MDLPVGWGIAGRRGGTVIGCQWLCQCSGSLGTGKASGTQTLAPADRQCHPAAAHVILYVNAPESSTSTETFEIAWPSAMRDKKDSESSGSRLRVRIWSTLRAPLSTSLQRLAMFSMRASV